MRNFFTKSIVILFVLSVSLVVAIPMHAEAVRGVTEDTIKIGALCSLTGPPKYAGKQAALGLTTYFKYLNDKGGINGRKVKLIIEDNAYRPDVSVTAARKLIFKDKVLAITLSIGSAASLAIHDLVQQQKVPLMVMGQSKIQYYPVKKYVFVVGAPFHMQTAKGVEYIKDNLKIKNPRVGVIYIDDDFGRSGYEGVEQALKFYGLKVIANQPFPRGAQNLSNQVFNLKRANVDFVIVNALVRDAATVLREAKKLDYHPKFIGGNPTISPVIFKLAGEAADGFLAVNDQALLGVDDSPGIKEMNKVAKKYTEEKLSQFFNYGWCNAKVLVEGIRRAGRDVTPEKIAEALEGMNNFDMQGLIPPVTYSPEIHIGNSDTRVVKADFKKKTFVILTPFTKNVSVKSFY